MECLQKPEGLRVVVPAGRASSPAGSQAALSGSLPRVLKSGAGAFLGKQVGLWKNMDSGVCRIGIQHLVP